MNLKVDYVLGFYPNKNKEEINIHFAFYILNCLKSDFDVVEFLLEL